MHRRTISFLAAVVAITALGLAVFIPSASAHTANVTGTYCENGTYTQYGECCPYNEYSQYSQYSQYCEGTTTGTGSGSSPVQTITPSGAAPAGVTTTTTYPDGETLVNVTLPGSVLARKFYLATRGRVSFGQDHSYKVLKKMILFSNGTTPLSYNITKLSKYHQQMSFVVKKAIASPTIKISKNVFEFTTAEANLINRIHIPKTLLTFKITTTTGKVFTVKFRAMFHHPVVIHIHGNVYH